MGFNSTFKGLNFTEVTQEGRHYVFQETTYILN